MTSCIILFLGRIVPAALLRSGCRVGTGQAKVGEAISTLSLASGLLEGGLYLSYSLGGFLRGGAWEDSTGRKRTCYTINFLRGVSATLELKKSTVPWAGGMLLTRTRLQFTVVLEEFRVSTTQIDKKLFC